MDTYTVNVALPRVSREFGAPPAYAANVLVAFSLAFASALITCSKLGDRFGQRRMFNGGLVAFALGSCLAGLAPTLGFLTSARVLQGLAAAAIAPQVVTLISRNFPDERQRATAFAGVGLALGLSTFLGQYGGALLVDANPFGLGWRLVFLANGPLALTTAILSHMFVPPSYPRAKALDWKGSILCILGVALTIYPLLTSRVAGWTTQRIACIAVGLTMMGCFVHLQRARTRRGAFPLIDIGVFRFASIREGMALAALMYSAVYAFFFCYGVLSQVGEERRATDAAVIFVVTPVCFIASSVLARRWAARDARRLMMTGAAVSLVSTVIAGSVATWGADFRLENLWLALALIGIGHGLILTPMLGAVLRGVPELHAADASGLYMTMQQLGGGIGVALVALMLAAGLDLASAIGLSHLEAYRWAFALGMIYCSVAAMFVLVLLWRGTLGGETSRHGKNAPEGA